MGLPGRGQHPDGGGRYVPFGHRLLDLGNRFQDLCGLELFLGRASGQVQSIGEPIGRRDVPVTAKHRSPLGLRHPPQLLGLHRQGQVLEVLDPSFQLFVGNVPRIVRIGVQARLEILIRTHVRIVKRAPDTTLGSRGGRLPARPGRVLQVQRVLRANLLSRRQQIVLDVGRQDASLDELGELLRVDADHPLPQTQRLQDLANP